MSFTEAAVKSRWYVRRSAGSEAGKKAEKSYIQLRHFILGK